MEPAQNRRIKWLGLAVGVLALATLLKIYFFGKPTVITVIGEGRVKVKPEQVSFTINFLSQANSPALALFNNTQLARDLFSVLKNAGVEDEDISLAYTQVMPPNVLLGQNNYQAVNTMTAILKDLTAFDNLINQLYQTGASSVSNIVFSTQDSRTIEKEAVALAVEDAQKRAKEMAKLMRKRIVGVVSVTTAEAGGAGAMVGQTSQENTGGRINNSLSQIEIVRTASIIYNLR